MPFLVVFSLLYLARFLIVFSLRIASENIARSDETDAAADTDLGLAIECCDCDSDTQSTPNLLSSDKTYCILQVNNIRVSSDSEASNLVTRLVLDKKFLFILRHQDTVIQMGSIP